jgi:hypothetical protein
MKINSLLLLWALIFSACVAPRPHPVTPPGGWGKYSGPIRTEWEQGRKMRLLEDARYIGPDGRVWLAPKGWSIDGASIPQAFWCSVGGPYEDSYRDASVFHDVACDQRTARWQDVHYLFYTGMRCSGVKEQQAKIMYAAVYRFGPRWPDPETDAHGNTWRALVDTTPRRNATHDEAMKIEAWVRNNNPSLQEIEQTTALPGAPAPR